MLGVCAFLFSTANAQSPGGDSKCKNSYNNCVQIYTPDSKGGGSFKGISEVPSYTPSIEKTCRDFEEECFTRQRELDDLYRLQFRIPKTLHEAEQQRQQAYEHQLFIERQRRNRKKWDEIRRRRPPVPNRPLQLASPNQSQDLMRRLMMIPSLFSSSVYDSLRWYR